MVALNNIYLLIYKFLFIQISLKTIVSFAIFIIINQMLVVAAPIGESTSFLKHFQSIKST